MSLEEAREVLAIEEQGLAAVRQRLGTEFIKAVELILACPSRLIVTGIGKSGIIGQKITATMNSTGTPAFFLHPVEAMHGDLGMVQVTDVVLAISYSGETAELNILLSSLKRRCSAIIAMTGGTHSTLALGADVVLDISVPREACLLGLAPTASTTATLALGDALAVVLMKRNNFQAADFRKNHPAGSLGERLKVKVSEVMLTGSAVPSVRNGGSISIAVDELNRKNLGAVVVIDENGRVDGILTDGDVRRLVAARIDFQATPVRDVMTCDPVTIASDIQAVDALSIMQRHEITILPVTDADGAMQGILHLHDLLGKGEFRFLL
ncbi:KpsF/GutQ family sugar-phosphate isomerase [Desulfofustis limnaeus]|jgi:arabinose-5-phosphate isomerase|uniref:D-arabinose 5-phosphate isomerase n=1 Tax=Desulfofustis limnaeus TaxID=2740163 RepID=A0ABM7W492_9BACT|nr:KpsF/GutQ family sugar-phosphate isomerase [Desulfofustis limnaeus]MDX9893802.1 KpsF/GutQ family sugar-phosphate isomerase [Desulfofustis sp.]BDD85751.1 D-arabinose 5-phosphate isomerase [Desulfofustis limnaeus]